MTNVVVAPLVEETLPRGVAIPVLGERQGLSAALPVSCVAFGLHQWWAASWRRLCPPRR